MDTTLRDAERALSTDPTAWRPVLALLVRLGRTFDAMVLMEDVAQRLNVRGHLAVTRMTNERICGARGGAGETLRSATRDLMEALDVRRALMAEHAAAKVA